MTELIFDVDADLVVPMDTMLHVTFWPDGRRQHQDGQVLTPVLFEEGTRLRIATETDALDRRYTVFAELIHEGERLSWVRVRGDFLQGDEAGNGEIRVRFGRACPEPADRPNGDFDSADTCGSHDTCVSGGCSSACYAAMPRDVEGTTSSPSVCPDSDCLTIDSLSVGRNMSCALSSGEAFCWGRVADMFESWDNHPRRPTRVVDSSGVARFASDIESIEVDSEHVCLIANGALRCGGRNNGDFEIIGPSQPNVRPCCERSLEEESSFAAVSLGPSFTCTIDDLGRVACLGRDPNTLETTPGLAYAFDERSGHDRILTFWSNVCAFRSGNFACTQSSFPFLGPDIDVVSAEVSTVCLVRDSAQLECYGRDATRQMFADVPHIVPGNWSHVSVSTQYIGDDNAFCAVTVEGELRCWGDAEGGRTGSIDFVGEGDAIMVGSDETWATVGVGQRHSCGLTRDGRVFCWGENELGQLGRDGPSTIEVQHVCVPAY
ncbi:MAG: RCC1 domain-containing protein [Polyangiales bacterium]